MFAFDDFPALKELLKAVSAGDEGAKEKLYEVCNPEFSKFAQNRLRVKKCRAPGDHRHGVMDASWGKIFKGIKGLRDLNSFAYWSTVIIGNDTNTHLKHCIREQREVSLEDAQKENEPDARLDDAYETLRSNEHIALIMDFAGKLHPKLPDILRFHEVEGLSFKETASALGISVNTVRGIYYHKLEKLGSMLEAMEREFEQRPGGPKELLSRNDKTKRSSTFKKDLTH